MKPGGRRAGEVDRHNTVFTTPSSARGRRAWALLRAWPVVPAPGLGNYVLKSIGFYRLSARSGEGETEGV